MYQETKVVKTKCRFTAAFTTLLCGAILGCLATFCGMMMIPGTNGVEKEQRQALGDVSKYKTEDSLT